MGESVIFTGIWGIIGKEKAPNGVGLIETLDVFKLRYTEIVLSCVTD